MVGDAQQERGVALAGFVVNSGRSDDGVVLGHEDESRGFYRRELVDARGHVIFI